MKKGKEGIELQGILCAHEKQVTTSKEYFLKNGIKFVSCSPRQILTRDSEKLGVGREIWCSG